MEITTHNASGSVVLWRLRATDRTELEACLNFHSLGIFMPAPKTHSACLKQALGHVGNKAATKEYTFRVTPRKGLPEDTGGWQLDHVLLDPSGRNVTTPLAGISVTERGVTQGSINADWIEPASLNYFQQLLPDIRSAATHASTTVEVSSMGSCLAAVVKHLSGVTLRDGGGVYWIPEANFPVWEAFSTSVEALKTTTSGGMNRILILRTDHDMHTVKAVLDTLHDETRSQIATIRDELAQGELGDKALKNRLEAAQATLDRVQEYEQWLGQQDDVIKLELAQLMSTLGSTMAADDANTLFADVF